MGNAMYEKDRLFVRTTEATSLNRATAFNPATTKRFFEFLRSLLAKYNFPRNKIYNVVETGVRDPFWYHSLF